MDAKLGDWNKKNTGDQEAKRTAIITNKVVTVLS
jgi:hypothetical protein